MYEVHIDEGIQYRTAENYLGEQEELLLDAYTPVGDDPDTLRPAVLWMSGGSFAELDRQSDGFATIAASAGMVAFSIDYRLRPAISGFIPTNEAVDDGYEDAAAAVEWILGHADEYRIDPRAIVVAGHSAGAITALNLAHLDRPVDGFNPSDHIAMAISDAGFLWPGTEPGANDPPSAMAHGSNDPLVTLTQAEGNCEAINEAGSVCELDVEEGGGHGRGAAALWAFAQPFMAEHGLGQLGFCGKVPDARPEGTSGPSSTNQPPTAGAPATRATVATPLGPRFTG